VGKKVKVVFDTNVWISIFMEKSITEEFLKAKKDIILFASQDILLEVLKVTLYPKVAVVLNKTKWRKNNILRAIEINSTIIQPKVKLMEIEKDYEDNKILECALAAKADIIVSGDKHLTELGKYKKTRILTPREFFDYITLNSANTEEA
jgi:uncharacterized protein